jgi:hypothetical protein
LPVREDRAAAKGGFCPSKHRDVKGYDATAEKISSIGRPTQELAMDVNSKLRAVDFPPLEFTISLDPNRSFLVCEKRGRSSGVFAELSSAILFVREECEARGCAILLKFDQNLACIRAAS